jgi:hypothetical protein
MNAAFHHHNGNSYSRKKSCSLSSSSSSWSGRIVARILPKHVPMDYTQLNKPIQTRVPPSIYVPGTGTPALRPSLDDIITRRMNNPVLLRGGNSGSGFAASSTSSTHVLGCLQPEQEESTRSSF